MDMGMGIVHVVRNVHEYIDVCQGFLPYSSVHHWAVMFGNPLPCLLHLGWWTCSRGKIVIKRHPGGIWSGDGKLVCRGVIIIFRRAENQASAYWSVVWLSGTCVAWCDWVWVKRHVLNTGNMMNLGGSSKWSGYVEILTTTFIAFIF